MKTEKERIETNLLKLLTDFNKMYDNIKNNPNCLKPLNGYILTITTINVDNKGPGDKITSGGVNMLFEHVPEELGEHIIGDSLNRIVSAFDDGCNLGTYNVN
jgi:hypothetical protein